MAVRVGSAAPPSWGWLWGRRGGRGSPPQGLPGVRAASGSGWSWECTGEGWDSLAGAEGRHARILITTSTGACQGPRAPANQSAGRGRGGNPQDLQPQRRCPQFPASCGATRCNSCRSCFLWYLPSVLLPGLPYSPPSPPPVRSGPQCYMRKVLLRFFP